MRKIVWLSCCGILLLFLFNNNAFAQAPAISYQTPQNYAANTPITPLTPKNTGGAVPANAYGQVTTIAGDGNPAHVDGQGTSASFNSPAGLTLDGSGNIYVADFGNNQIRKITLTGEVTTFAGNGSTGSTDGVAGASSFNMPTGIAINASGDIYVADEANNRIRRITAGTVTTFAGNDNISLVNGIGTAAEFFGPYQLNLDNAGNIYVGDSGNNAVRKITPAAVVTTYAGTGIAGSADGPSSTASFFSPGGVAMDAGGNLYVSDHANNLVRKINAAGLVSTLAGSGNIGSNDGIGAAASFYYPGDIAVDAAGNVYVADSYNNLVRKITPAGVVTTLAGDGSQGNKDGIGTQASFYFPVGIVADAAGNIYISDCYNNLIKKISITGYTIDKPLPAGLTFDPTTGIISGTPTSISPATDYTVTAYNASGSSSTVVNIAINSTPPPPLLPPVISYQTPQTYKVNTGITPLSPTNTGGPVQPNTYGPPTTFAAYPGPLAIALDSKGNIFITTTSDNSIVEFTPGQGSSLQIQVNFSNMQGIVVDKSGRIFFSENESIMQENGGFFAGSNFAGSQNGTGFSAGFSTPSGLAIDASGNIYVADLGNREIREITPAGVVTTLAGTGAQGSTDGPGATATFGQPRNIAVDAAGNVYVSDQLNNNIRKITPAGVVSTLAGSGAAGSADGLGTAASFNNPGGIAVDAAGNIYVADVGNGAIREISPAGLVKTIATGVTPYGLIVDNSGNIYYTDPNHGRVAEIALQPAYIINKPLPAGLTFDTSTGIISGTPTVTSPATDYTVTAYNAGGSSSTVVNIKVISNTPLVFGPIPAKTTCDADFDPDATGGSGTITYTSANTAVATIVSGKIHVAGAGTSNITATDGTTTLTQLLTVNPPITPTIALSPQSFSDCAGTQVTFTAEVTGAGTNPTYQWRVNGQNAGTNIPTFTSSTLGPNDKVTCTLTNTTDCTTGPVVSDVGTASATLYTTPTISITSGSGTTVAAYTPVTFTAAITYGGTSPIYQWYVNNQQVGINSPTYTDGCVTDGDVVTCNLTNQGGACLTTLFASSNIITMSVTPPDVAPVTITASANPAYAGATVVFTAIAANPDIATYEWFVNDVDANINTPVFTSPALKNGDVIDCVITLNNSCTLLITSNKIVMAILPAVPVSSITIPNAFTPNGDGYNDLWDIPGLSTYPNCLVSVFDRYGSRVFQSRGYSRAWNGTMNGNSLPLATYYYIIDLGNNNPKLSGHVTIIR